MLTYLNVKTEKRQRGRWQSTASSTSQKVYCLIRIVDISTAEQTGDRHYDLDHFHPRRLLLRYWLHSKPP